MTSNHRTLRSWNADTVLGQSGALYREGWDIETPIWVDWLCRFCVRMTPPTTESKAKRTAQERMIELSLRFSALTEDEFSELQRLRLDA